MLLLNIQHAQYASLYKLHGQNKWRKMNKTEKGSVSTDTRIVLREDMKNEEGFVTR
jgi:hypothetical protein